MQFDYSVKIRFVQRWFGEFFHILLKIHGTKPIYRIHWSKGTIMRFPQRIKYWWDIERQNETIHKLWTFNTDYIRLKLYYHASDMILSYLLATTNKSHLFWLPVTSPASLPTVSFYIISRSNDPNSVLWEICGKVCDIEENKRSFNSIWKAQSVCS